MIARKERLEEFMRRLESAPPASTFNEAYELVCKTINAVEDELTTIPFNPEVARDQSRTDGRMYPPQLDNMRVVPDRDDVKRFRTRGHNTLIANNGAIQIWDITNVLIFSKNGADGKSI
jgi:hypothetical protein